MLKRTGFLILALVVASLGLEAGQSIVATGAPDIAQPAEARVRPPADAGERRRRGPPDGAAVRRRCLLLLRTLAAPSAAVSLSRQSAFRSEIA